MRKNDTAEDYEDGQSNDFRLPWNRGQVPMRNWDTLRAPGQISLLSNRSAGKGCAFHGGCPQVPRELLRLRGLVSAYVGPEPLKCH